VNGNLASDKNKGIFAVVGVHQKEARRCCVLRRALAAKQNTSNMN
jgi:hypothetical protein